MRCRTDSTLSGAIVFPSKETVPLSGHKRPIMSRSRVDFPQPLGPIKTVVAPVLTARSVGCRASI